MLRIVCSGDPRLRSLLTLLIVLLAGTTSYTRQLFAQAPQTEPELQLSNRIRLEPPATSGGFPAFAFAPDGQALAGGTGIVRVSTNGREQLVGGGDVLLWNARTGRLIKTLGNHKDSVRWLHWSDDGRVLVSASRGDGKIKVWDMPAGRLRHTLQISAEPDSANLRWPQIAISGDGKSLAAVTSREVPLGGESRLTNGGELTLWDLTTGRKRWSQPESDVHCVAFDTEASELLGVLREIEDVQTDDRGRQRFRTAYLLQSWSTANGETLKQVDLGRMATPEQISVINKESVALITSQGLELRDRSTGEQTHEIEWHDDRSFGDHDLSSDGTTIGRSRPGWLEVVDVATGTSLGVHTTEFPDHLWHAEFSPSLDRVACQDNGDDHRPVLFEVSAAARPQTKRHAEFELVRKFEPGHRSDVRGIAVADDGLTAVSAGGTDHTIRIWNLATGKETRAVEGHDKAVWCVDISPDAQWAVSTDSAGGQVILWDVATGRELRRLEPHGKPVQSAAISPDGALVASGGGDGLVRISNPQTGEVLQRIKTDSTCLDIAFHPDGPRAVLGTFRSVSLWDVRTGRHTRTFDGNFGESVDSVAISADGELVAAGGLRGKLKVWDLASGKVVGEWEGHDAQVNGVAFLPGERLLVSGAEDASLRLWDVDTAEMLDQIAADTHVTAFFALLPDGEHLLSGGGVYRNPAGQHVKEGDFALYLWRLSGN